MTKEDMVQKWRLSATEDLEVAKELFQNKRYAHCLFFCQLALEKLLKGEIVNLTDDAPPITHDLVKLTFHAKLAPKEEQIIKLREITTFNIEARYDIQKERLYKKATESFTRNYLSYTEELFSWIHKQG